MQENGVVNMLILLILQKCELMSHLSLYLLYAISPSHRLDMKFKNEAEDTENGSILCNEVFGKYVVTRYK